MFKQRPQQMEQRPRVHITMLEIVLILLSWAGPIYGFANKHFHVMWFPHFSEVFVGVVGIGGACLIFYDISVALRPAVRRYGLSTKVLAIMLVRSLIVAAMIWLFIHGF